MNGAKSSTVTGTTATVKRGRFAPSPTGRLHLGSLYAAVGSYLDARLQGSEWWVRIENIDRAREVAGAADDILRTLEAYGLHWDGPVLYQHTRSDAYRAALETLAQQGLAYRCDCERRDYAAATVAGEIRYPGRCRTRDLNPSRPHAWRLRTDGSDPIAIHDRLQPPLTQDVAAEVGDFVLWRKDGFPAYQLAVVIDDAAQGMTDIVRGLDLYDNTPRQRLLQSLLALPTPTTLHLPLLMDVRDEKLAKSKAAVPVEVTEAPATLYRILTLFGLDPPPELTHASPTVQLAWAVDQWRVERLPRAPSLRLR